MSSFSEQMTAQHLKATRAFGYVLNSGTFEAWQAFSRILSVRLTVEERAALAFMALRALDKKSALDACVAAFEPEGGAGMPVAPLFNHLDEATFWADLATADELDAYVLACFKRMSRDRQAAFVDFATRRSAA